MRPNEAASRVLDSAMRVHTRLGAGLLASAYDACLSYELRRDGIRFDRQLKLPVYYDNLQIDVGYRVDFLVENCLIIETKAVEKLLPVHTAQLLSYLKLSGLTLGLLINFNVPHLRLGIKRVINGPQSDL